MTPKKCQSLSGKQPDDTPQRAPWGARTQAWLIDLLIAATPLAVGFPYALRHRRKTDDGSWDLGDLPSAVGPAQFVVANAVVVLAECGLSPGCRIVGIARVNERTGRRVGLARALLRVALMGTAKLIMRPWRLRRKRRLEEFQRAHGVSLEHARAFASKLRLAEVQHQGDQGAIDRAQSALHREHSAEFAKLSGSVDPLGCWIELAGDFVLGLAVNRLLGRLRDRLTGRTISVVR